MESSYFLVAHGSRDSRPQVALKNLGVLFEKVLADSKPPRRLRAPLVETGTLEFAPVSLAQQLEDFGKRTRAVGLHLMQVMPLFLLPGVHVREDIPREVALAQASLGTDVKIELQPYLGSHPGIVYLLSSQIRHVKTDAWILLSHGSRRPGSEYPIELLAAQLGAVAAFWLVSPSLQSRVEELVNIGCRYIGIVPYFLFVGEITDALAQEVAKLSLAYTSVNFYLANPLSPSVELANLILDLTRK
ncbi:MAG TPA: sirohydrochlorin chelatase [Oscillatoriaceae cyanobacterium M7585_C2015_266]|nr:sirohydrochlorin chelatase [Oscillatoriaceae cyanobacterium M7585_C2015_266]